MGRRDIRGDYKREYVREYQAHRKAGRESRAQRLAKILRESYGVEVDASPMETAEDSTPLENAAGETVSMAPKKRGRPKMPRDEKGNIVREE